LSTANADGLTDFREGAERVLRLRSEDIALIERPSSDAQQESWTVRHSTVLTLAARP
jgi:hypothetical protein